MIMAKPIRSVGKNTVPSIMALVMVAENDDAVTESGTRRADARVAGLVLQGVEAVELNTGGLHEKDGRCCGWKIRGGRQAGEKV